MPVPVSTAPVGAAAAAVPAIVAPPSPPPAPSSPVVESFLEETHVCKSDDTLAKICQDKYHDARYQQALLMYNRSHPMAGAGIYSDPPALQAGQRVMMPPLSVLEKRYGQTMSWLPRQPAPVAAAVPAPAAPVAPVAPVAPPPAPSASWSSQSAGFRLYTVQGQNETLWDIAKRNLGSGERWSDITALNSGLDAMKPVPVGTLLHLPAQ
jgi:nucleoid-associated protein YgaU